MAKETKAPEKTRYSVLKQLPEKRPDGEPYQAGDTIELTRNEAKYLLLSGHLALPQPKTKPSKQKDA